MQENFLHAGLSIMVPVMFNVYVLIPSLQEMRSYEFGLFSAHIPLLVSQDSREKALGTAQLIPPIGP